MRIVSLFFLSFSFLRRFFLFTEEKKAAKNNKQNFKKGIDLTLHSNGLLSSERRQAI